MTNDNTKNAATNTGKNIEADAKSVSLADRKTASSQVPFFLRAWWLKDFPEFKDLSWLKQDKKPALWSNYSDPICDLGDMDVFDES